MRLRVGPGMFENIDPGEEEAKEERERERKHNAKEEEVEYNAML